MTATLSILGLAKWSPQIWDNFNVPEGLSKQTAISSIIMEASELELLYSDWPTMQELIGVWSARRNPIWEKLYATTQLEYNPIENYDRMEDWKDTGTQNESGTSQITGTSSARSSATDQSTTVNSVQGYDGSDWANHDKSEVNGESSTAADTDTTQDGSTTGKTDSENIRTGRAHGNIGVTTTQQMIVAEREVRNFDIYDVIANDFIDTFCLGVY